MSKHSTPLTTVRPALARQRIANQFVHCDAMVEAVEAAVSIADSKTRGGARTQQLDDWREVFNARLRIVAEALFNADECSKPGSPEREAHLNEVQHLWQRVGDHVEQLREAYPHIAEKLPAAHDFVAHGPALARTALNAMALRVSTRSLDPRKKIEAELAQTMGSDKLADFMARRNVTGAATPPKSGSSHSLKSQGTRRDPGPASDRSGRG